MIWGRKRIVQMKKISKKRTSDYALQEKESEWLSSWLTNLSTALCKSSVHHYGRYSDLPVLVAFSEKTFLPLRTPHGWIYNGSAWWFALILYKAKLMFRASVPSLLAWLSFAFQRVFGTTRLQRNCATIPFFSLLPFTWNNTLNVLLAVLIFLFAKLNINELDLDM